MKLWSDAFPYYPEEPLVFPHTATYKQHDVFFLDDEHNDTKEDSQLSKSVDVQFEDDVFFPTDKINSVQPQLNRSNSAPIEKEVLVYKSQYFPSCSHLLFRPFFPCRQ